MFLWFFDKSETKENPYKNVWRSWIQVYKLLCDETWFVSNIELRIVYPTSTLNALEERFDSPTDTNNKNNKNKIKKN